MVTREVDGSLPVLVADAERSALLDQPLRNLEMSVNAGVVQRPIAVRIVRIQLCIEGHKPLRDLEVAAPARSVDRPSTTFGTGGKQLRIFPH